MQLYILNPFSQYFFVLFLFKNISVFRGEGDPHLFYLRTRQ